MSTPPKGWAGFGAIAEVTEVKRRREELARAEAEKSNPTADLHGTTGVATPVPDGGSTPVATLPSTPVPTAVATPATNPAATLVPTGVPTTVATPVPTPVSTGAATPVATGVESEARARSGGGFQTIDSTHTASEQKVYSVMYRETISRGLAETYFPTGHLQKLTGIASDKTVRKAVDGLIEKLSIEIVEYQVGNRLGPLYRVHGPRDIFAARKAAGMVIDPVSKKIRSTGVATPVATPVPTAVSTGVATVVGSTGVTPVGTTGLSHESHENPDDDLSFTESAIRDLVPVERAQAIAAAAREIDRLVAEFVSAAGARAKGPPASAAFAVECVRRALAVPPAGKGSARARPIAVEDEPASAPAEEEPVYVVRRLAAQLLEAHRTDPGFDRERLRALVYAELVGEGKQPDGDVVDEAIRGMA